jgi:hypothetical protein
MEKMLDAIQALVVSRPRCDPRESNSDGDENAAEARRTIVRFTEGIRLPHGGWLKSPFDELRFNGKQDSMNPMRFLKRFESVAKYENIDETEQIYFFGKCLKDQASVWWELHDFINIRDAKDEFVAFYWSDDKQARFREKLYTGKYKTSKNIRMSDYALDLVKQAKLLQPPMTDRELIRCIKRHFDKEIAREIRATTARTISDLIELLEEIQDEREFVNKSRAESEKSTFKNKSFEKKGGNFENKYAFKAHEYSRKSGQKLKTLPW